MMFLLKNKHSSSGALTIALLLASSLAASFVCSLATTTSETPALQVINQHQQEPARSAPLHSQLSDFLKSSSTNQRNPQTIAENHHDPTSASSSPPQLATLNISPNIQITTLATPTTRQKSSPTITTATTTTTTYNNNCSSVCSVTEFTAILQRITQDNDILRHFREINDSVEFQGSKTGPNHPNLPSSFASGKVRQSCVRELISMIKKLASNELEMKTLIEFASDTGPSSSSHFQVGSRNRSSNNSSQDGAPFKLQKLLSMDRQQQRPSGTTSVTLSAHPKSIVSLDLNQIKWLQSGATFVDRSCYDSDNTENRGDPPIRESQSSSAQQQQLANAVEDPMPPEAGDKSRVLPKLIANVDHWINTLERFTITREWGSLMKVFQGTESILDMFVKATGQSPAQGNGSIRKQKANAAAAAATATLPASNVTNSGGGNNASNTSKDNDTSSSQKEAAATMVVQSKVQAIGISNSSGSEFMDNLRKNLPSQVLTLTTSLNNLFPWHVWPWNNLDLYTTIDTFLNHGIFAFSKTTVGPERRIDFLPNMLQTLFKSLKYETFPRKCTDWSKIICDKATFHDRLVMAPPQQVGGNADEIVATAAAVNSTKEREDRVKEMSSNSKNLLTQELTCIMFSSLSMQQFGAQETDFLMTEIIKQEERDHTEDSASQQEQANLMAGTNRLSWDRQVHKALKLYSLSREALSDEQWLSIYNLIHDLWAQQKITDRVVMVGRVVQLLTNCHMPKEMLESALWKDIYKYKNVLNQLIDIAIEELNRSSETGKLTVEQISLGSKNLHEILSKFIRLLPKLVESLSQTVVDQLPDLVGRFFTEKAAFFKVPCKGYSFSDIIPSLSKYREEIVELEELVCQQTKIKPNITMMQINNLTNDFLAMAFNFSTFGNALTFPKLLTNLDTPQSGSSPPPLPALASQPTNANSKRESLVSDDDEHHHRASSSSTVQNENIKNNNNNNNNNVSSIIDEMAANPRLAQIVAILQSSALDPPEVHAELPELDWVEAGTSIALLYDSIQKLMSYEEVFTIFPELDGFQEEMNTRVASSKQMFKKFSKRDPIRLVAYSLDVAMPVALRTFKPTDSFHGECLSSFRDIFSEDIEGKATRQWQCLVSSVNFGSWAMKKFMKTFNSMFKNILTQMTADSLSRKESARLIQQVQQVKQTNGTHTINNNNTNSNNNSNSSTCIFFDGSVSLMLDNLPQFIDLALETVLMASTTSDQQMTLYDIMCSSNYMLDPFNERSVELKARMKDKMCLLFHKSSLTNCAEVLKVDQWTSTMKELNSTWFELNAIALAPSFREITLNAHEFLELFGQFKPSTMSDSLLARVLNVNSFWTNLLNRTTGIIDKYQEKRFEYALQTLTPIIYDNLPISALQAAAATSDIELNNSTDLREVRETLVTTILGARAILSYLDKQSNSSSSSSSTGKLVNSTDLFEVQIQALFSWADQYSQITAETLLRTIANNITKFEGIFYQNGRENSTQSSSYRLTMAQVWSRFCSSPVDTYLDLNRSLPSVVSPINTTDLIETNEIFVQMNEGKESICKFEWNTLYNQIGADSNRMLADYPERQLTRIALTKWGQVLDMMFIESKNIKQLPKFFYMDYWQDFSQKLPQISPLKDQPSNLVWIWIGFERIMNAMDAGTNQTSSSLVRILDQLNCGLDAVKGGLSWENIANIYQDKQDILAAHSTINNGFALASIGVNTFLAQKKFQKFLDEFVKPRVGLNAFCEIRDRSKLENIFSIPSGEDFLVALESFQELICDTNFETLAQNINPISVCYQITNNQQQAIPGGSSSISKPTSTNPLADILDRFFKLASLAILDAKLVAASEAKPPILDKNQWSVFWSWWSVKAEPQPKSGVVLMIVRGFQTIDSINSNHVVWKALFKLVHEISEIVAYLLRAVEKKHQEVDMIGATTRLLLVKEAATQIDTAIRANANGKQIQQQQLASTLSNIMFPEVNNFISFMTFKQLRYLRLISDYFTSTQGAQESVCRNFNLKNPDRFGARNRSQIELIGYKLNTNEKLYSLLCHYHSSQWLTALNIVISTRAPSIPKKVNYMTKYLSIFTRSHKDSGSLESFMHSQQLENIENVANTTVSYLLATSQSLKSLSFSKISNISWHSLPNLLDSIDRHLCASKFEHGSFHIPIYEPRKPELETVLCKLPQWNITQVYNYLSENFDLQNMISLITQQNNTISLSSNISTTTTTPLASLEANSTNQASPSSSSMPATSRTCVTPFKFASRWLKIGQEIVDEAMSKTTRDKIRKCLSLRKKGQSVYSESLRYIRIVNSILSSINDLTSNDSWHIVKKTWSSVSYLVLNQNPSYVSKLY